MGIVKGPLVSPERRKFGRCEFGVSVKIRAVKRGGFFCAELV